LVLEQKWSRGSKAALLSEELMIAFVGRLPIVSGSQMKTLEKRARRILVVDDEPTVGRAIVMLLKHDGHIVETVENGADALAMFEPGKFDLIITDYSMQDMKGDQLAALIKERQADQPIIMATAFAEELQAGGKVKGYVDCLLNKPFSMAELREAVARCLSS
jgi:CheY-like chemotaxis protein